MTTNIFLVFIIAIVIILGMLALIIIGNIASQKNARSLLAQNMIPRVEPLNMKLKSFKKILFICLISISIFIGVLAVIWFGQATHFVYKFSVKDHETNIHFTKHIFFFDYPKTVDDYLSSFPSQLDGLKITDFSGLSKTLQNGYDIGMTGFVLSLCAIFPIVAYIFMPGKWTKKIFSGTAIGLEVLGFIFLFVSGLYTNLNFVRQFNDFNSVRAFKIATKLSDGEFKVQVSWWVILGDTVFPTLGLTSFGLAMRLK